MTHILTLYRDILRRIASHYRVWRLLQLTCTGLYNKLGDYHESKNIVFTRYSCIVTYTAFVQDLIVSMKTRWARRTWMLDMYTTDTCDDANDQYLHESVANERGHILKWNGDTLTIMKDRATRILLSKDIEDATQIIIIGSNIYCLARHSTKYPDNVLSSDSRLAHAWIYDELPELFRAMQVTRPLSVADI